MKISKLLIQHIFHIAEFSNRWSDIIIGQIHYSIGNIRKASIWKIYLQGYNIRQGQVQFFYHRLERHLLDMFNATTRVYLGQKFIFRHVKMYRKIIYITIIYKNEAAV